MKKFTSLLLLFLVCLVQSVGAQDAVTTVDQIKFSTDGATHYYKIKNKRSGKYAAYAGDAVTMQQKDAQSAGFECIFFFTEVQKDGLTDKKCAKIGTYLSDKKCAEYNLFTAEGTEWYLVNNSKDGGFLISKNVNGDGNNWDDQGGQTTIGYWHEQNNGTTWTLEAVSQDQLNSLPKDGLVEIVKALATSIEGMSASVKAEGTVGYHYGGTKTQDEVNTLITESKNSTTSDELTTLKQRLNDLNKCALEANDVTGKYFQLQCANRSVGDVAHVAPYNEGQEALGGRGIVHDPAANVAPMSALWQLEVSETMKDRYYLKHANSNQYFGELKEGQINVTARKEWSGQFFLAPYTAKQEEKEAWTLSDHKNNGQYLCTQNPQEGNKVNHWSDKNDPGAGWKFVEVKEISVTLTDAKYATLNLPMAVKIADNSQLTAYVGKKSTENANELILTKLAGGVIPANTPVILAGEAGSYNLSLEVSAQAAEAAAQADNELKGTTIEDRTLTSEANYALGKLQNGTVGFKVLNRTTMPANKAYLPKNAAQTAMEMSFAFEGGQQTGIQGVTTGTEGSHVYYDLQGRRVLYPTKGIYVNAKGQKVFLK